MKGFRGCECQSKCKELLPEFQHRLFENQKPISFFIFHSSFYSPGLKKNSSGNLQPAVEDIAAVGQLLCNVCNRRVVQPFEVTGIVQVGA
jgi:hypothetical protein